MENDVLNSGVDTVGDTKEGVVKRLGEIQVYCAVAMGAPGHAALSASVASANVSTIAGEQSIPQRRV